MAHPVPHAPVRDVSDAEVTFYQDHGWAVLPGLVAPDYIADLRERALVRLREREGPFRNSFVDEAFGQDRDIASRDEAFGALALSPQLGGNVVRLLLGVSSVRLQVTN